jgi:hypothetical protein
MLVGSLLSSLFVTERHRAKAGSVGFAIPTMVEITVPDTSIEPLVTTNMTGRFLATKVARQGYVRMGFHECELVHEGVIVNALHSIVSSLGVERDWANRSPTVELAVYKMLAAGYRPLTVVTNQPDLKAPEGVTVRFNPDVHGTLLCAEPRMTGLHIRVKDHVGVIAHHVDKAFVVVA